jgi:hypothetical protein
MQSEQTEPATAIAKKNQVFTEHPHRGRRSLERAQLFAEPSHGSEATFKLELFVAVPQRFDTVPLIGDCNWVPIAAKPSAPRGFRPNPSEHRIVRSLEHDASYF